MDKEVQKQIEEYKEFTVLLEMELERKNTEIQSDIIKHLSIDLILWTVAGGKIKRATDLRPVVDLLAGLHPS